MEVSELVTTLKHGRPLCSFEVDGAIELVERLQAENAELKKNVELAVENHQICSLMDAGLIERKHRHIQDLEKENADLRKCWKCGKDDCNHRNLVAVEQVELLAVRLELSRLQAENERLRKSMEWISVDDRLPDHFDDVLVICKDRECWVTHHEYGQWWRTGIDELKDVTHWMPLPPEPTDE